MKFLVVRRYARPLSNCNVKAGSYHVNICGKHATPAPRGVAVTGANAIASRAKRKDGFRVADEVQTATIERSAEGATKFEPGSEASAPQALGSGKRMLRAEGERYF